MKSNECFYTFLPDSYDVLKKNNVLEKIFIFHVKIINVRGKISKFEFLGNRQTIKTFYFYISQK